MTNARGNRPRNGKRSQGRGSGPKKFSWQERQNDAIVLRDTQSSITFTTPASGTSSTSVSFNLAGLGPRLSTIAAYFTRFKFTAVRIRYVPVVGSSTSGSIAIGIVDDTDNITTGTTVSPEQCRINTEASVWRPTSIVWEPIDKEKWYYTSNSTVSDTAPDPRLITPATLVLTTNLAPASTSLGTLYIDYVVVLKGAVPSNLD